MSEASGRVAEMTRGFQEAFGVVPGSLWMEGFMIGAQIVATNPEVGKSILDAWFEAPHSDESSDTFFAYVDFIAEGKMPV